MSSPKNKKNGTNRSNSLQNRKSNKTETQSQRDHKGGTPCSIAVRFGSPLNMTDE